MAIKRYKAEQIVTILRQMARALCKPAHCWNEGIEFRSLKTCGPTVPKASLGLSERPRATSQRVPAQGAQKEVCDTGVSKGCLLGTCKS